MTHLYGFPAGKCYGLEKKDFLNTFGKNRADYDLAGENGKISATKIPLGYYFHTLKYLNAISPQATERDTIRNLIDG